MNKCEPFYNTLHRAQTLEPLPIAVHDFTGPVNAGGSKCDRDPGFEARRLYRSLQNGLRFPEKLALAFGRRSFVLTDKTQTHSYQSKRQQPKHQA
jgi:hypothetical protein